MAFMLSLLQSAHLIGGSGSRFNIAGSDAAHGLASYRRRHPQCPTLPEEVALALRR